MVGSGENYLVENLILLIVAGGVVLLLCGVIFKAGSPKTERVKAQLSLPSPSGVVERVGIVLVHGIGEQRRFQHLDSQMRYLLRALRVLEKKGLVQEMSVDIAGSPSAAFAADQDTWQSGQKPSITVTIDHILRGPLARTKLLVHEVWWADVNEPYSLGKQFRFWLWGLAVWTIPERREAGHLGTANRVFPPVVNSSKLWDRLRLYMVGVFFVLLGYSVGTFAFLAARLLNWQTPNLLRTATNYLSGVKIYNQERRYGPGLLPQRLEFLDSLDEPPRVSIRRRMIRALADVATDGCDRWYVLAHSQGTVVAFNGLMETCYSWPGYLDEARWDKLKGQELAGPMRAGVPPPSPPFLPRRPSWASDRDIAYRSRIFRRFRGLLTYGSPLQKFAGLWPALVPISRERAFPTGARWFNILDPLDPVSGRLEAFKAQPRACCPRATDYGYASYWFLLVAHLRYLTHYAAPMDDAATRTIKWMLADTPSVFAVAPTGGWRGGTWYAMGSEWERIRSGLAWFWWFAIAALLLVAGAFVLPMLLEIAWGIIYKFGAAFGHAFGIKETQAPLDTVRALICSLGSPLMGPIRLRGGG
jgi:hypothetical protein